MNRSVIVTLALAAAAVAAPIGALDAQVRAPNISAPKRAAQNAVNRTNAQTSAVTAEGAGDAGAPGGQPIEGRSGQGPAALAQAQAKSATTKAAAPAAATTAAAGGDTARTTSVAERGAKGEITFYREQYTYEDAGRRDPFYSLFASGDLRPVLTDLRLVAIIYDPTGRNSVAILRDVTTKDQYRVKVGQMLGRMRVTAILPKQINIVIDEFGYSRQESLALIDPTTQRTR